jgi:hypothetical protein
MRVKITKIPNAAYGGQQPDGALDVTPSAWGGADVDSKGQKLNVRKTLTSVPRKEANLEAEGGETAFGPISGDTIPDHMTISGPRHSKGGVPLDLPEDTFIFSDTSKMKIKDPSILRIFGKSKKKGGYTPAELAKPYDINKYKAILMDPDSDRKDRETAELMIKNYIMKLGALAIAQESKKGFPQGIPEMARPYMEANGISEEDLMPQQEQEGQPEMPEGEMAEGGTPEYFNGGFPSPFEMSMEKAKETDFTALSAPKLDNPYKNTADDPIEDLQGNRAGVVLNSETGGFDETKKREGTKGQDISYEVGIKNAYDVDGNMLADQGAYLAGVATNIGEQVKTSKKMKSIFDKSVDQDARENVFSGLHYANTPGVVAPSGVSPTTVQYKRSQYGGELDRFVYGGDEPIAGGPPYAAKTMLSRTSKDDLKIKPYRRPKTYQERGVFDETGLNPKQISGGLPYYYAMGELPRSKGRGEVDPFTGMYEVTDFTSDDFINPNVGGFSITEQKYGGTPMSVYGMEMGGAYYPTMSTGGTRRVKITGLPGFDKGGTYEEAVPISKDEWSSLGPEWKLKTDAKGRKWKVKIVNGQVVEKVKLDWQAGDEPFEGTSEEYLKNVACGKITASGMTVEEFIADANKRGLPKLWDYSNSAFNAMLKDCEAEGSDDAGDIQGRKYEEEPKDDPKDCQCPKVDADGNEVKDADGNTVYITTAEKAVFNEETQKWECAPCQYEETITTDPPEYEEPARWSQRAIGNLLTQGRFRTDAERLDPELIDIPEYSPVLQRRYDQDIQSNLAGLRKSIDTGGGTAQQKLFQNLAALDQATTQVGKRQKQTEDYNINVLNQAAQISANLQQGTDAKNQQSMMNARRYNAQAGDKETAAKNAKMQAMNLAKTDAQNEMLQKATWNFNNPEFQIDYKTGMPYYDPNYKEANPTKGQKDLTQEYMRILGDLGADDENNKQVAYNLAVKSVYGNVKTKQYGGYISGNDMYPFFND